MEWGVASLSLAGEERSGDAYVVKVWEKTKSWSPPSTDWDMVKRRQMPPGSPLRP